MRRVYVNLAIALLFLAGFVASAHLTRDLDAAGFAHSAWNATIIGMFHAFIAVLHLYNALNCYSEYREYRDNHLPQEHDDFDENSYAEDGTRPTPVVDENGNRVRGLFWTDPDQDA